MATTRAIKRHMRRIFVEWALSLLLLLRWRRCNVEDPILPATFR